MSTPTEHMLGQRDNRLVARLLKTDLPRMQPAALKHAYLTSVANVLRNPVAERPGPDGERYVIGFGDVFRRTTLSLIIEPSDNTVRHAFVPRPEHPIEKDLIADLQANENQWATDHGLASGRNLVAQFRARTAGDINLYGLPAYTDSSPFDQKFIQEEVLSGKWYMSRPISPADEIKGHHIDFSRQDETGEANRRALDKNVSTAASIATPRPRTNAPVHYEVELDKDALTARRVDDRTLRYKSVERIDEPEL